MKTEFNLSEKAIEYQVPCPENKIGCLVYHFKRYYSEEDVREAVKKLIERAKEHDNTEFDGVRYNPDCNQSVTSAIYEIFGDKLIGEEK